MLDRHEVGVLLSVRAPLPVAVPQGVSVEVAETLGDELEEPVAQELRVAVLQPVEVGLSVLDTEGEEVPEA